MSISSIVELKNIYQNSRLVDVATYTKAAKEYLADAILRENVALSNQIVVSLFSDRRVSGTLLYSAEDTTSPYIAVDYGLMKNMQYTVPADLITDVSEGIETIIMNLPSLGYTVEPFWGYTKGFGIIDLNVTTDYFTPVRCFRIRWSNV